MANGAEGYLMSAKTWHKLANDVAGYSPKMAVLLREHANSLEALAAAGKW